MKIKDLYWRIWRISLKFRVVASFLARTRTPISLILDALHLTRRPFVAISDEGIRLRLNPGLGESFTFYECLVQREYLSHEIALRPGDTVVDIGANIGAFTVLAAKSIGPSGRVIAFEPILQTFERLRENVALNAFKNVKCRRAAVDGQEGTLTLRVPSTSAYASAHIETDWVEDESLQIVPCVTLEQVCQDEGIGKVHLLKVDCEGSEHEIFERLSPELAVRIDQIVMEVHQVRGKSLETLHANLRARNFSVSRYPSCWVAINQTARGTGGGTG
jgi:FkbM family methyltransferase